MLLRLSSRCGSPSVFSTTWIRGVYQVTYQTGQPCIEHNRDKSSLPNSLERRNTCLFIWRAAMRSQSDIQYQQVKTVYFQLIECIAKIGQRFDLQTIVRGDDLAI